MPVLAAVMLLLRGPSTGVLIRSYYFRRDYDLFRVYGILRSIRPDLLWYQLTPALVINLWVIFCIALLKVHGFPLFPLTLFFSLAESTEVKRYLLNWE